MIDKRNTLNFTEETTSFIEMKMAIKKNLDEAESIISLMKHLNNNVDSDVVRLHESETVLHFNIEKRNLIFVLGDRLESLRKENRNINEKVTAIESAIYKSFNGGNND